MALRSIACRNASSLAPVAGQLDRVALLGDVDDAAAEDVGHALHLVALLADGAHLDQHQLALDVVALGQVDDLDHLDQRFSCLVICSITSSEPVVTIVMRDSVGSA